jgi:putative oxidoreductase
MFSLAILITLLRGIPIGCGCFTSVEDPLGWGTLGRDLLWLSMTLQVYFFTSALQLEGRLVKSLREVEA